MVLRKPYKFLIKHFKLIHLVLAIISGYLLIKTNGILNFFNDYLNNNETLIGTGTVNVYFNSLMTIFIFIMLIGTIIIGTIMKMKDKPIKLYIVNLITYIFVGIIYIYNSSLIEILEIRTLEIRTIKLASDLTLICFLVQTFSTIILSIRAVGFNLKKFDFGKDMELEIDEKDNEEFEFDVNIDKNKIRRKLKRNLRNLKYTYHENKFITNIVIVIILLLIGLLVYMNIEVFNKVYKKGELITTSQFTYSLVDSYTTDRNYKNNKITNNYLVVTKIRIKNNTQDKLNLETARILLQIGKVKYNPTTKYKDNLLDLGVDIEKKNIKQEFTEYIITFEIPRNNISKKMILNYNDINGKDYNIKLDNISFDEKQQIEKKSLSENMIINDKILNNVEFKINNIEIGQKIRATYNFCETKEICYESYEYVVPTLTDNYEKVILKIESIENVKNQNNKNFIDLSDYIEKYGTLKYVINNEVKNMNTTIKEVKPTKSNKTGVYYFEVYDDVIEATEIYLLLNVRNKTYEYKIK